MALQWYFHSQAGDFRLWTMIAFGLMATIGHHLNHKLSCAFTVENAPPIKRAEKPPGHQAVIDENLQWLMEKGTMGKCLKAASAVVHFHLSLCMPRGP